jgi:ComF family protein
MDEAYAWGKYQYPLNKPIQRLKYSRDIALGETLSRLLFQVCREMHLQPDLVVAVPLSRKRQRSRGYNQAAMLARPLAWMLGTVYRNRIVHRVRDTASQVGLSIERRRENMVDAFTVQGKTLAGKTVLLVDDVLTTGATLDAAAKALKQAGAKKVTGLVVARA